MCKTCCICFWSMIYLFDRYISYLQNKMDYFVNDVVYLQTTLSLFVNRWVWIKQVLCVCVCVCVCVRGFGLTLTPYQLGGFVCSGTCTGLSSWQRARTRAVVGWGRAHVNYHAEQELEGRNHRRLTGGGSIVNKVLWNSRIETTYTCSLSLNWVFTTVY